MKTQIRIGTFETNSSSTHTICIVSSSDFLLWKCGDFIYDYYENILIPKEDALLDDEDDDDEKRYYTYDEFWDELDYTCFEEPYTAENGTEITAFGYYGYN